LTHLGIFPQIQRKALWADFDVREVRKAVESKEADVVVILISLLSERGISGGKRLLITAEAIFT
jgi:hypothetical protein